LRASAHIRSILLAVPLALAVAGVGAGTASAAATYQRTVGGPGHAEMYPSGLEVDAAGNLYVADTGNDQVASYAPDGRQRWRVGSIGPKAPGRFENPRDVAVVGNRVYVADLGYNRVQVLDTANGALVDTWQFRFASIIGISGGVDRNGQPIILTSDDVQNVVRVHGLDGTVRLTIGGLPYGNANGQLNAPRDADTDSSGHIYVADYANDRMAKFGATGVWIRNWGSKGSGPGQFARPYGVAVGPGGWVWVADSNNGRLQAFDVEGNFQKAIGQDGEGPAQFAQLRRVAVGGPGVKVFGADLWGNKVLSYTQTGLPQRTYGGSPPPLGRFNEPSGIAVESKLYVADSVNQRMQRFDAFTGSFEITWGSRGWGKDELSGFNWPRDIAISGPSNSVWVADTKNNRITEFNRNGVQTGKTFGKRGTGLTDLNWPFAIAPLGGDLVVADTFNHRVQLRDTSTFLPRWTATGLTNAKDVAVRGNEVYVAATGLNKVVVLNASTGAQLRSFGALAGPQGIAVEAASGDVWVADTNRNRIVEFSPTGVVKYTFGELGSAHGQFNNPTHIEISNGRLYVSDEWNDRIEVFTIS
jgi:DNA-binding beta-propeller fold protein YncE